MILKQGDDSRIPSQKSSLVGLVVGDFTIGRAALKVASSKVAKHEKMCSDNQHDFITFGLSQHIFTKQFSNSQF